MLTEWQHTIDTITQMEEGYVLNDDTRMTILLKIMPKEYIEDLRDIYTKGEITEYHDFEQALQDEISNGKMDDEMAKGGNLNEIRNDDPVDEGQGEDEQYVETHVWVNEMNCWVCGLAPKRQADGDNGDGHRDDKRQRSDDSKGSDSKGKGKEGQRSTPCATARWTLLELRRAAPAARLP